MNLPRGVRMGPNPASHVPLGPSQAASAEGQKVWRAGPGAHNIRVLRGLSGICTVGLR